MISIGVAILGLDFISLVIADFALLIDVIGAIAIIATLLVGLWPFLNALLRNGPAANFRVVRSRLGHGFIFSLDILIAATLLRMVLAPSLDQVAVLSVITLLRIMLALSLDFEVREIEEPRDVDRGLPPKSDEAA